MDRKLVRRTSEVESHIEGSPVKIDAFIETIKQLSGEQDISKIDIQFGFFGSYDPTVRIGYSTPETDREYEARLKKEEKARIRKLRDEQNKLESKAKKKELAKLKENQEKQFMMDLIKKYPVEAKSALLPSKEE